VGKSNVADVTGVGLSDAQKTVNGGDVSCSFGVATSLHPTVAGSNPGHSSLKVFIFL
jgi:hypothetical protein